MKNIPTKLHQSAKKDYYTQNDDVTQLVLCRVYIAQYHSEDIFILFYWLELGTWKYVIAN